MNENTGILIKLYSALQLKDYSAMGECYHAEATFRDPVFDLKHAEEIHSMWEMLFSRGKDMEVIFSNVKADETTGSGHWETFYTFSSTGRKVHNVIDSTFTFKDGLILHQEDTFSFPGWSKQAFGLIGVLLGRTVYLRRRVQRNAMEGLYDFMGKKYH